MQCRVTSGSNPIAMFLRLTLAFVHLNGLIGIAQHFSQTRQIVPGGRYPHRRLLFIKDTFLDPVPGCFRASIVGLHDRIRRFVSDLEHSPELADRAEQLKRQLLNHPEFAAWTNGLWGSLKEHVAAAADDPESDLRKRIEQLALTTGERLVNDAGTRATVDAWIGNLARHLAARSGPEVAGLIANTVERWDADETSRRLELQVGRDLQFIRINGTIVGGLAGLVIHALVLSFGG